MSGPGQMTKTTILLLLQLLHPFNGLFSRTTQVSWYQKGKISLDLNEARYDGVLGCTGISYICKQSASRSRQITTPTPHHSILTGWMLFLAPNPHCRLTNYELLRRLVETPSRDFAHYRLSGGRPDML